VNRVAARWSQGREGLLAASALILGALASPLGAAQVPDDSIALPQVAGVTQTTPRLSLLGPPTVTIGAAEGASHTLLNGVISALRVSDSTFLVGDAGNERLLVFDRSGDFIREVGRRGDGPGEFRLIRAVGQCASDARLTLFERSGDLVGSRGLPIGANFDPVMWCSGSGTELILFNQLRGPVRRGEHMTVKAVVVRASGAVLDTVAGVGDHEYFIGAKVAAMAHVPLGKTTLAAGSRAGAFACATVTGRCVVFDSSGRLASEFVVAAPRRPVTPADWKAALESHLGTEPSAAYRAVASKVLAEIEMRTLMPRFDRVVADDSGRLWIRTLDQYGDAVAQWVVLSSVGQVLGVVRLPRRLELIRSGDQFAIGVDRDADGVERVKIFMFGAFLPPIQR
jgi:hypothetical protein